MSEARRRLADSIREAVPTASPGLIQAFTTVPRERFLPPGPWKMRDMSGTWMTEDANPDHVYRDTSIAVDATRDLYNGQPSTVARWLDAVAIHPGDRILHVGCGSGYFTAILAATVGPRGAVYAIDVDGPLTRAARENLKDWPWVTVQHGDGITGLPKDIDVVVLHAGASHIRQEWLACTRPGARMLAPITVDFAAMGPTLGKGLTFVLKRGNEEWSARSLSFVAIYSMQSARDANQATTFGMAMQRRDWETVTRLRTDSHKPGPTCWCHWGNVCLSRNPG
jgi:protein-L-isoaspartate(D-aspartate) O-methyltransferase